MSDYIKRADAICEVLVNDGIDNIVDRINALPSAEAVSREVYEETDGVVTIEKQNAKEVGEIKHIVIRSPNYTRYFYNESMPLPADAVQGEWIMHGEPPWYVRECSKCGTKWHQWSGDSNPNYCGHCGARMKGGEA